MQQPPNPYPQQQWHQPSQPLPEQQWQQQHNYAQDQTYYPPQQPAPLPQQWNPQQQYQQQPYPTQPLKEPKRTWYRRLFAWCRRHPIATAVIIVVILVIGAVSNLTNSSQSSTTTPTTQPTQSTQQVQVTPTHAPKPTPTQKPKPTPKPAPTQSPAQAEQTYKSTTTNTTVVDLDKQGNNDQYKQVHFTAQILNFVKDENGNTAGANVGDPDSASSSVIQIAFPEGTDLSRLNQGDTIEVWGMDDGTSSGQNVFGGTVQEVGITALYLTDLTTNYRTT